MTRKKLYILDVSGFIFRAYFALPPMTSPEGESTHGLFGFIRSVIKLFKDFSPDHIVAVFDGPDNKKQRREIYEKYKANRTQRYEDLPEQIDRAKAFCELIGIPHLEVAGVEADDAMGSVAKWAEGEGADVFLCTSDKDLCQLVSKHIFVINPWKDNLLIDAPKVEELYGIPPHQIIDYLAIAGDSSDNIPGLKGFGPKTAISLLKEFGTLETILSHPDKVKGAKKQETLLQDADVARLSQRLATIHTDIDFPKDQKFFSLKQSQADALRAFYLEMGFHSLVRELDAKITPEQEKEAEEVTYHLVDDPASLERLITLLNDSEEVCFDVETTHIRPLIAEPVGIGFCLKEREAYYVPLNGALGSKRALAALKPLFENPKFGFYAHNAKYDCHVLANVGIAVARVSFDTLLASYVLSSGTRRHSLDQLALTYFGKVKTPIKELIGSGKSEITMLEVPIERVKDYCCEDVDYTVRLKGPLEKELQERKLSAVLFDLELPLTHVLQKMERAGMFVDVEHLKQMSAKAAIDIEVLEKEIYKIAGEAFNLNSPKQLSAILFEKMGIKPLKKTATGLSTRAEVLEALALEHPIAATILEYRALDKLKSTYLDTLPKEVNPNTLRIHPTFNQFIAATGRLACQDPNLQNIPIRSPLGKMLRRGFRPQVEGWSYLSADYSQIELRLLAHLSEDPALLKAFSQNLDIHAYTSSLVLEKPLDQVTPEERQAAKAINFGIIYGQQAYGLAQQIGIDMKKAAAFIDAYFTRYPKVRAYIESCVRDAKRQGVARTMIGRERQLPEIHSNNATIRAAAERLAINTPLQGSAADLIKLAMLKVDANLEQREMRSFMILQIHDELIFEAPDEEIEQLAPLVKGAMEGVFSLKVPLVVDISVGKNWGEC